MRLNTLISKIGEIQIDNLFKKYSSIGMDDSEFLPVLDEIIEAFREGGVPVDFVQSLRSHALKRYHELCQKAKPESLFQDNKNLMLSYLAPVRRKVWKQIDHDPSPDASIEEVAKDVRGALENIDDLDNLNDRAGAHSWGYVEPSEAANELCEEAVQEFFDDMNERIETRDFTSAAAICKGIVLGLHDIKGVDGAVIEWAGEDTMSNLAGEAVETFLKSHPNSRNDQEDSLLPDSFWMKMTPKWADWLRDLKSKSGK